MLGSDADAVGALEDDHENPGGYESATIAIQSRTGTLRKIVEEVRQR